MRLPRPADPNSLRPFGIGLLLASLLAVPASAQVDAPPLARYLPSDGLVILVEHNGLDSQSDAWKGTSAYRMLNQTSLGAMVEDIATQLIDRALASAPGAPLTGKDAIGLLEHLSRKGFVVGYCGSLNPPDPKAGAVVIRDAARNEAFKRLIAQIPPLNEPAATLVEGTGGRKVFQAAGPPIRWWYEKDDAVFSFAPPGAPDPVVAVLDGKAPNALAHPARVAAAKGDAGEVPVGLLFVDITALPPMPPKAADFGLDALKRVEGRWAIQGNAVVGSLGVQAPRPRKGILAILDQPPIGPGARVAVPPGVTDYTLMSIDPIKVADTILAMMKRDDPDSAAAVARFVDQFKARTGLSVRDDLLARVGPRMAVVSPPGGALGGLMMMWFHPPDLGIVAEVKDAASFGTSLDKLMEAANRELKAAGAMVPPQPGQEVRAGTAFAEFRRLKPPERGYILSVPPSVLPTPAGLRPTLIVDSQRGLVALAASPGAARRTLGSLVLDARPGAPAAGSGPVVVSQSDPSGTLPELLANIPAMVQFVAASANSQPGGDRQAMFRLQLDPDAIPDVEALRRLMFPTTFTVGVDDASIRATVRMAFPFPSPQLNAGMETPVLIALLLPAVQSAREAARRAQCVNNLKQIGLAMFNYNEVNGNFPSAAICDKSGKPLLSWRVAILPFLEQQALYNKFKLDEPWDSPNNKELIQYMPSTFTCPSRNQPDPGTTTYRVFLGGGSMFEMARPTRIVQVTDGTSNTILAVEANEAVPWTKPEGIPFAADNAAPDAGPDRLLGAGSKHPGGFNTLFSDGSVKFIKTSVAPAVLRALITRAGGEVISSDSF